MILELYNENWAANFKSIQIVLEKSLAGLTYVVEHIGSTAVPNLDAKPIIDIDIIYKEAVVFEQIKSRLTGIGYYHNGNQGIDEREVFKRSDNQCNAVLDTIPHHLYVCPAHCNALERHLLFRNYLRKNDWARLKYQNMKYTIAEKANQDRKAYARLKEETVNDFIDWVVQEEKSNQNKT